MGPTVHETDAAIWERMQQLNVTTLVNLLAAVTQGMIAARSGRIVTVGAHAALRGVAGMGDRQSVVEGKSVSVRVDLGGRRIIKKTTHQTTLQHSLSTQPTFIK